MLNPEESGEGIVYEHTENKRQLVDARLNAGRRRVADRRLAGIGTGARRRAASRRRGVHPSEAASA
jgi:hypothetical protein